MSQSGPPEITDEKEFNFEEGVEKTLELIDALLSAQKYVVVAISGPLGNDTNVGKTTLLEAIAQKLTMRGIPYIPTSDENSLRNQNLYIKVL